MFPVHLGPYMFYNSASPSAFDTRSSSSLLFSYCTLPLSVTAPSTTSSIADSSTTNRSAGIHDASTSTASVKTVRYIQTILSAPVHWALLNLSTFRAAVTRFAQVGTLYKYISWFWFPISILTTSFGSLLGSAALLTGILFVTAIISSCVTGSI